MSEGLSCGINIRCSLQTKNWWIKKPKIRAVAMRKFYTFLEKKGLEPEDIIYFFENLEDYFDSVYTKKNQKSNANMKCASIFDKVTKK